MDTEVVVTMMALILKLSAIQEERPLQPYEVLLHRQASETLRKNFFLAELQLDFHIEKNYNPDVETTDDST